MSPPPFVETEWGIRIDLENQVLEPRKFAAGLERTLAFCREREKTRLLVDARGVQRNVSSVALLEGVESASRMPRALRIAFVAPHLVEHEDSQLASNAGYTRGVYIRYFATEDEAMTWLLAEG